MQLVSDQSTDLTIRGSLGPPSASLRGQRALVCTQRVPRGWRQWFRAFFGAVFRVRAPAEHSGPRGVAATAKAQTTRWILPRAVDAGVTSVRVYRLSRQGSPQLGTVRGVGTNPCEETVRCFESTPHSDIPSVCEVRWRRT